MRFIHAKEFTIVAIPLLAVLLLWPAAGMGAARRDAVNVVVTLEIDQDEAGLCMPGNVKGTALIKFLEEMRAWGITCDIMLDPLILFRTTGLDYPGLTQDQLITFLRNVVFAPGSGVGKVVTTINADSYFLSMINSPGHGLDTTDAFGRHVSFASTLNEFLRNTIPGVPFIAEGIYQVGDDPIPGGLDPGEAQDIARSYIERTLGVPCADDFSAAAMHYQEVLDGPGPVISSDFFLAYLTASEPPNNPFCVGCAISLPSPVQKYVPAFEIYYRHIYGDDTCGGVYPYPEPYRQIAGGKYDIHSDYAVYGYGLDDIYYRARTVREGYGSSQLVVFQPVFHLNDFIDGSAVDLARFEALDKLLLLLTKEATFTVPPHTAPSATFTNNEEILNEL
jgi:hypothetical protein